MKDLRLILLAVLCVAFSAGIAPAQDKYPNRPVKVIVPLETACHGPTVLEEAGSVNVIEAAGLGRVVFGMLRPLPTVSDLGVASVALMYQGETDQLIHVAPAAWRSAMKPSGRVSLD